MSGRDPWAALRPPLPIRPAGAADAGAVAAFLAAMDRDGLYQRHFSHGEAPNLALLRRLQEADGHAIAAFVATDASGGVIAHAEFVADGVDAEFALMVLPRWRHVGLGSALLQVLVDRAAAEGHRSLTGLVQATNTAAIGLARRMDFATRPGDDRTTVVVSLPLAGRRVGHPPAGSSEPVPDLRHDPHRITLHRRPGA